MTLSFVTYLLQMKLFCVDDPIICYLFTPDETVLCGRPYHLLLVYSRWNCSVWMTLSFVTYLLQMKLFCVDDPIICYLFTPDETVLFGWPYHLLLIYSRWNCSVWMTLLFVTYLLQMKLFCVDDPIICYLFTPDETVLCGWPYHLLLIYSRWNCSVWTTLSFVTYLLQMKLFCVDDPIICYLFTPDETVLCGRPYHLLLIYSRWNCSVWMTLSFVTYLLQMKLFCVDDPIICYLFTPDETVLCGWPYHLLLIYSRWNCSVWTTLSFVTYLLQMKLFCVDDPIICYLFTPDETVLCGRPYHLLLIYSRWSCSVWTTLSFVTYLLQMKLFCGDDPIICYLFTPDETVLCGRSYHLLLIYRWSCSVWTTLSFVTYLLQMKLFCVDDPIICYLFTPDETVLCGWP